MWRWTKDSQTIVMHGLLLMHFKQAIAITFSRYFLTLNCSSYRFSISVPLRHILTISHAYTTHNQLQWREIVPDTIDTFRAAIGPLILSQHTHVDKILVWIGSVRFSVVVWCWFSTFVYSGLFISSTTINLFGQPKQDGQRTVFGILCYLAVLLCFSPGLGEK